MLIQVTKSSLNDMKGIYFITTNTIYHIFLINLMNVFNLSYLINLVLFLIIKQESIQYQLFHDEELMHYEQCYQRMDFVSIWQVDHVWIKLISYHRNQSHLNYLNKNSQIIITGMLFGWMCLFTTWFLLFLLFIITFTIFHISN